MRPAFAVIRGFPKSGAPGTIEHIVRIVGVDGERFPVSAAHAVSVNTEIFDRAALFARLVPNVMEFPALSFIRGFQKGTAPVIEITGSRHQVNRFRFFGVHGNGFHAQKSALRNIDPVHHGFPPFRSVVPAVGTAHVRSCIKKIFFQRRSHNRRNESAAAHGHTAPLERIHSGCRRNQSRTQNGNFPNLNHTLHLVCKKRFGNQTPKK